MSATAKLPQPGQIAKIRQRHYLVDQVIPPPSAADSTLVRLSCLDDDAQGQQLEVLWEREIAPEIQTGEAWKSVASKGFDQPKLFASYLNTLKWNCVTSTDPRLFQSPFRAGIRLDAYQLEPLQKALLLPRVNLFIADDVGLGKTIEAGLIARELLLRKKAREIIVCCPPSMLYQWQDELEARFGLTFEILDKAYVTRVRRERGYGVNPWGTHTRFLVSQRLLIDEAYTNPLLDWLGPFRPGSLLILDEAHHAAPSSGQRYAIDSQITRAVSDLAHRFEHKLFLSATPHNGHSNSFSALLEILDPQRFCRGVPAQQKMLNDVMVRRLKEDLRTIVGGLPERVPEQIDLDGLPDDAPELRLAELLDQYRRLREERLKGESRRKQAAAGLLITGLQQRLFSSVEAFSRTLRVHRATVQRQWEAAKAGKSVSTAVQPQLDLLASPVGSDDDRAELSEEELQAEEEAQVAAATESSTGPMTDGAAEKLFRREQAILEEMAQIADEYRGRPDARVRWLIDWIRTNMCPKLRLPGQPDAASAPWNDLRILIFTEYDDTKRYVLEQLSGAISGTDQAEQRIAVFAGSTRESPPKESTGGALSRKEIRQAFLAHPSKHPIRILIATDAAREGLNLQAHCWNLFHFDVPWNPSRMEQRNGRIDRKLQPRPKVYCHYFVYRQRPEDRILQTLIRKTDTIKRELGSLSQVIDGRLAESMKLGIRRDRIDALEKEIESADIDRKTRQTVEDELEASRQRSVALQTQIDQLRDRLAESQKSIGFDKDHFQSAISCSLELMNASPLKALTTAEGPQRLAFPALDQREGADPTWADTMDTLRRPRSRDERPWEWRSSAPIRPVVFDDPGNISDEVVHLHLEHRVVQRLLGRLSAQGFVHHDLSRACLTQTTDPIPRVILLGRLCLYGQGAARLHEELIPVTARWQAPDIRNGPLAPYARTAETRTMHLLDEALLAPTTKGTTQATIDQLQKSALSDIEQLLPHLQTRAEEYRRDAEEKLTKRGDAEAKAMQQILTTQKAHIEATIAKHDKEVPSQLKLQFQELELELRQLQSNRRYWQQRLDGIARELVTEPQRIRDLYVVKAARVEPVGLVYLWPVTG